MRAIDVNEMKAIQLDILKDVADFCDKNGLRYYLAGGTLLGAVRHKGFIPWDDDIDIAMPRPDYEKFINTFNMENRELLCWKKDNKVLITYAKVYDSRTELSENGDFGEEYGINIDIFPVDGLPKSEKKAIDLVKRMKLLWGLVVCATVKDISKRKPLKKLIIKAARVFFKIFPIKHYVTGRVIKAAMKYPFDNSDKVAVLIWGYGIKEIVSKSVATEFIKADFEDQVFNIPKNYDEYMTSLYGDYMTPPPENKRLENHGCTAYWKEDAEK